jgi:hypothetical protein
MSRNYEVQMRRIQEQSWDIRAKSIAAAIARAEELSPHFKVVAVDDKELLHRCEGCRLPIFNGGDYETDCEGVVLCPECAYSCRATSVGTDK